MKASPASDFRRIINARWIGYDPDRMKPAHIANGLYLQVLGQQYKAETVNRLTVPSGKKGPIPQHSTEKLLEDMPDFKIKDEVRFNLFRQHMREHLGADDAIFDRQVSVGCAYSSANEFLVTDDRHNDGWAGNFIGLILSIDFGQGPSEVLTKLRDALANQTDPLSVLLLPFLDDANEASSFDATYGDQSQEQRSELVNALPNEIRHLRLGIDTFASYYPSYLSKERFTRLLIILASLTLLRHIVGLAETHLGSARLPFLIDALQTTGNRTRFASQLSFIRCRVSVSEMYIELIQKHILESAGNQTPRAVRTACEDLCGYLSSDLFKTTALDINAIPDEDLLAHVSRQIAERLFDKGNFMEGFLQDVGIRCGVLMPRGNAQPKKHFDLQPDTLEAIVLACIRPNDPPLTMGQFTRRLWERFGILIGGGPDDLDILSSVAIREINQDDLTANYDAFTRYMVALGLARQHSDGLVLVRPSWR